MSMSTAQLVSVMSDGVAKRLGTAEFDGTVKILCNEHTMSTEQLVACMRHQQQFNAVRADSFDKSKTRIIGNEASFLRRLEDMHELRISILKL